MEVQPETVIHQSDATANEQQQQQQQPPQMATILRSIDELVEEVLKLNNTAVQQRENGNSDDSSLRAYQSTLLQGFKDAMINVHSKVSKATHQVELQLGLPKAGPNTNSQLENLAGVEAGSYLNRYLGRTDVNGKPGYKLRDFAAGVQDFQLSINDDSTMTLFQDPQDPSVVLQPTMRNVWVLQHAYAKLLNHKENLINEYLATANPTSRKFTREYYEELGLVNLPSKRKLGNLLDVKRSSHNHETHDLILVLVKMDLGGCRQYVEPVTGDVITIDQGSVGNSYLVLPMVEASLKMLYDVYRAARKATSGQRRALNDSEYAAKMGADVDPMDGLQKQLSFIGGTDLGSTNGGNDDGGGKRKRRRMQDDDEGR